MRKMNRYELALEEIKIRNNVSEETYNIFNQLVKRATSKRVYFYKNGIGDSTVPNGSLEWTEPMCPECDFNLYNENDDEYDFCPLCGQALKWPEENM